MARVGKRYFDVIKAHIITTKNANAPAGKHYDLTEGNYVDDPVQEGYHWSNDLYKMVPD